MWMPVRGYEGVYEVSSCGDIRRVSSGRILKTTINTHGRPQLSLCKNNIIKQCSVQTIVCEAFHGPRPHGYEVAHWDGDRLNNNAENLRWATHAENEADKWRHGTAATGLRNGKHTMPERIPRGEAAGNSKLLNSSVARIREMWAQGGKTSRDIAAMFGVTKGTVLDIVHRKTWRHL
jgi:hypothetical protein